MLTGHFDAKQTASGFTKGYLPPCPHGAADDATTPQVTGVRVLLYLNFTPKGISPRHEGRNSSRLRRNQCDLRVRSHVQNAVHAQGRYPRGNLFQLPPVLHWETKAGRYGGPRRALRKEVREVQSRQEEAACITGESADWNWVDYARTQGCQSPDSPSTH